jgi:hypothetical protein
VSRKPLSDSLSAAAHDSCGSWELRACHKIFDGSVRALREDLVTTVPHRAKTWDGAFSSMHAKLV